MQFSTVSARDFFIDTTIFVYIMYIRNCRNRLFTSGDVKGDNKWPEVPVIQTSELLISGVIPRVFACQRPIASSWV